MELKLNDLFIQKQNTSKCALMQEMAVKIQGCQIYYDSETMCEVHYFDRVRRGDAYQAKESNQKYETHLSPE